MNIPNRIYVRYDEIRHTLNDADVVLFRGYNWMAKFISVGAGGTYSHAGILSWSNGGKKHSTSILEILEFKSYGGAATNLDLQIPKYSGIIDIYRPVPEKLNLVYNPTSKLVEETLIRLQPKQITQEMRRMAGLPYGFKRIWWLIKYKIFGLFINMEATTNDNDLEHIYPICSTAIAHCFSKYGYDLVKNKSDEWTEPSDIARSPLLQYMFTIIG